MPGRRETARFPLERVFIERNARAFKRTVCDENQLKRNKGNCVQRRRVIETSATRRYRTLNGD